MTRCPHCNSYNTEKNHIHNSHDGMHAVHAGVHLGIPILAAAMWLAKKVVDAVQDKYQCKSCQKTFS